MKRRATKTSHSPMGKRYDALCKQMLAHKIFLAWILKSCLEEFQECTINDILENHIIGIPEISKTGVLPDEEILSQKIDTTGIENISSSEGRITFDIRFHVRLPQNDERIGMIINIEAQNNFYPGYPLIKRGIYYGSRMISSQNGIEFTDSHYENIKKVCSIWICTNPPKYRRNTITSYSFTEKNIVGSVTEKHENYDLMEIIMVCLGKPEDRKYRDLLRLLSVILAPQMTLKNKKQILKEEFQIRMTSHMEKEADNMCNLSEGIWEDGLREGQRILLKEKVQKKLEKGKNISQIADELEESLEIIQAICDELMVYA